MNFLKELYCLCVTNNSSCVSVKATVTARNQVAPANLRVSAVASSSISANATFGKMSTQSMVAKTNLIVKNNFKNSPKQSAIARGFILEGLGVKCFNLETIRAKGFLDFKPEKFAGEFGNFDCLQKLYPTQDLFVSGIISSASSVPLYSFIDEGVFSGPPSNFNIITNDSDYITPSSYTTSGTFSYKARVDNLFVRPDQSSFRFRASAPLSNIESFTPPKYTLKNINLLDPSGNLIVRYKDVVFFGDNYFTVYSTLPQDNRAALNDWNPNYPLMHGSGYSLSFDIQAQIIRDVFNDVFDGGFEEYRRQPKDGLVDTVKISAIEICNSGGIGPRIENYVNFYMEVDPTGHRLEKIIRPIAMPLYPKSNEIWPVASSVWSANNGEDNTTHCGIADIIKNLRNDSDRDYITMISTDSIGDSGRLFIKFGHDNSEVYETTRGSFGCAFDESICGMWIEPSGAYNTLNKRYLRNETNFFTVDSVSLKVLARKASGSRDYALDVVGYSDDFLLNITQPSGGFLQNIEGVGTLPFVSSVYPPNDPFGTLQNINLLEPSGGDHYLLATKPLISSTDFKWYEIPLKIFPDNLLIGQSRDYSISSLFEQLYLDIYPIPSGAEIASMQLLVRYAPQNGMNLITQGGENIGKSDRVLKPVSRPSGEPIINTGSGVSNISTISDIPNGYKTDDVKSNYSRRWRGMEGLTQGAFDPNQFDFSFNNPLLDYPFLYSYYSFDNTDNTVVYPQQGSKNASIVSNLSTYKYNNIGWRLINDSIFNVDLPGYSGLYRTLDWTSLANGGNNFANDPLYGKIADAFSSAIQVKAADSYIKVEDVNISGGFAAYVRFSPGPTMSGVGYNFWNSGVLLAKYADNVLQFGIFYNNGRLQGVSRTTTGGYAIAQDSLSYQNYQYPLSIVLTCNDNGSSRLKLYTNNETNPSSNKLRATSAITFSFAPGSGDLFVGHDPINTSNWHGVHGFITELGISDSGNLVQSNPNVLLKQTSVEKFFENQHMHWWDEQESYTNDSYKLWSYIDEDTQSDWNLGDFKYCQFGPAFSQLSKRTGRDLISFNIRNSGTPYIDFIDSIPSTVNANVSYHTQIENDFLRFNLSNVDDDFYVANTRISKNLPKDYKFSERAIVVETILEHESSGNINWGGCRETGPKLIVSLYAKTKDPYWPATNWGLVNRSVHYLESNSCFIKLNSEFDYKNYTDQSEEWALFPSETRLTEFNEKYYSADVNDMILQYDLVYPSGSPYYSRINIHSANVRLEDAFININRPSGNLNITTSGAYPVFDNLNLFAESSLQSPTLNLHAKGPLAANVLNFPLYTSGALSVSNSLNLYLTSFLPYSGGINIVTSGSPPVPVFSNAATFKLYTYGRDTIDSTALPYSGLSLTMYSNPQPESLLESVPLVLANDPGYDVSNANSENINLFMFATNPPVGRYAVNSLNLYTFNNNPRQNLNLTLYSNPQDFRIRDVLNLHTNNYFSFYSDSIEWNNRNYGWDIDVDDNSFASLPANDEIRGVDLIGYGDCGGNSPAKAIDPALITHDTTWREATCNDGGIFRAIQTYTGAGYSGNYYGIRKYKGLLPNAAYNVVMRVTTGSTDPISVPNEWEEWEYGTNDETNFDNAKLIADSPSGISRNANDNYAKSVAVAKDLLAVGAPNKSILDESNVAIPSAGSIALYKRAEDIPGKQAKWEFLDELVLPSGYRRDYISATYQNMLCFPTNANPEFCVSGQRWNIGQEGRELGYSIDIANSGDRQVVVAGAPKAKWTREFDPITVSGVPVAMMVFTDAFSYDKGKIANIASTVNKWNILYKYFSASWPQGFQPQIDLKLIICQLVRTTDRQDPVFIEEPWVYHTYLNRLDERNVPNLLDSMTSGIKSVFNRAFPYNTNRIDNNIPAILGIFEDNSPSTTNGAAFRNGVDSFVNEYYLPYSYASGVVSAVNGVALSGYVLTVREKAQSWESASTKLIDSSLDYRNLIASDNLKYITSGVGQQFAQSNAYEFQIPPPSGGRVYIFENENNKFNLVQSINSPDEQASSDTLGNEGNNAPGVYGNTYFDLFGHDVAISDNGNIIAIGSPYSSKPCLVYARQDSENNRMFSNIKDWFIFRGQSGNLNYYNDLLQASGFDIASKNSYYNLSQSDKFFLRSDEIFWSSRGGPINLYKEVYSYSYGDIAYTGTWKFISHEFAGTSRLGWSTDVSEDGTSVVFGAPTDSFNEYDDTNVWYDETNRTWASYTNAGAVRVFESRNYYPHNLAVEYFKFGNLDRTMHPDLAASGHYDDLQQAFVSNGIPFATTQFAEVDIPQEAGLAFIITPEIDAASDEIIQRIKEWLALGDRTLVLVGNDPVWEEKGLYSRSNKVINKILEKLGSRMRLHPARNEYESLQGCADVLNSRYNVVPSFVPAYAHSTNILAGNLYANGVADIRMDLSKDKLQSLIVRQPCDADKNPFCELPIQHLGDLRAEWNEVCEKTVGDKVIEVRYKENWPFHFGNKNPAQGCDDYPESPNPLINTPNLEPRPILTAAEWLEAYSYIIPAQSGCTTVITPIYSGVTVGQSYWEFGKNHIPNVLVSIFENAASEPSGQFKSLMYGKFIDPEPFVDVFETRDALLQATGVPYFLPNDPRNRKVDDYQTIVAQYSYSSSSKVVLIANQFSENAKSFDSEDGSDENYYFYNNLVFDKCNIPGTICQLGQWTQRSSFSDAYESSILANMFDAYGHIIYENSDVRNDCNVLWIANPAKQPTSEEFQKILNWLDEPGNKKLVITYNENQAIAKNVKYLCEQLNIPMGPFYSASEDKFLNVDLPGVNDPQILDAANLIISGCNGGYAWLTGANSSTKVNTFRAIGDSFDLGGESYGAQFIPISGGSRIVSYDKPLTEKYSVNPDKFWKIDAKSEIEFETLPGSGYRLFVNWVREAPSEKYGILAYIQDASADPSPEAQPGSVPVNQFGIIGGSGPGSENAGSINEINTEIVDFQAPLDKIKVIFETTQHNKIEDEGFVPKTPRILSISGCLLPIEEKFFTSESNIIIGYKTECEPWYIPEFTGIVPATFRPVSTDSSKYCQAGCKDQTGRLIQDGPVVMAEEYESFSSFSNGLERSRIVVLSDSTMIQGKCSEYRDTPFWTAFVRSLYPVSPTGIAGQQFSFVQKLVAPERGSPGKYYSVSGIAGLASNFGQGIVNNDFRYTSDENDYNPATKFRIADPLTVEEKETEKKKFVEQVIPLYSVFPRLSGEYIDPTVGGGTPDRVKAGLDDLIYAESGYAGDLFGFSVAIHKDQIVVGAKNHGFSKETISEWNLPIDSGNFELNANGGAGAAFTFQKTFERVNGYNQTVPWEFKQKIRPSSLKVDDNFGFSLAMDADFVAIGAPGHDYRTTHEYIYAGSAAFIRKDFTNAFDIPQHTFNNYATEYQQDIGAVFTYQNKLSDWQNRSKTWTLAERINASGYQSPQTGDNFGAAISIDRARRGDADYTLVAGAPMHDYATSGNHTTGTLSNAGAAFVYDAMIREQASIIPNSGSWIDAKVFGASNNNEVSTRVYQNVSGSPVSFDIQGLVFTNNDGEIYLEASGFDPAIQGFIAHRPKIEFINALLEDGTNVNDFVNMFISGAPPSDAKQINLILAGADSAMVYNNLNLTTTSWNYGSGSPPLNMSILGTSGVWLSGGLNIVTSGIGGANNTIPLNLRIRGK